jgi:D-3-phosphoglycerate dehydrogenase
LSDILCTGPVEPSVGDILSDYGRIVIATSDDEKTLCSMASNAIGIVARGNSVVSGNVIAAAPALKVIGRSGSGFDSVDVAAANARRIPIAFAPNGPTRAVAEGVLAMMLATAKRLPDLTEAVRDGRWTARLTTDIRDLEGGTLGIIGFGRIGRKVAELAAAFDMDVIVADPYIKPGDISQELVALDELARRSDYISLHAPLTSETHHIVDEAFLNQVKPGAILVNVSRGGLVDLAAVRAALEDGRLDWAGLDVFEDEPPGRDEPLLSHPRVILSPHAIALSRLAKKRIFVDMSNGMASAFRGDRPEYVANPEIYT